jgi:hypothetical protein
VKRFLALSAIFGTLLFLSACQTTSTTELKTGAFKDDFTQMFDAYKAIDALGNAKLERKTVEKLGFNFDAKNVERVPGITAFRRIFGDASLQHVLTDPNKFGDLLREMNTYHAYFIPFRGIKTVEDRFYFSRKNKTSQGNDLLIVFIFKREADGDYLLFHDYNYVKVDSKESSNAFAAGVIEIIEKYGGAASGVKDLVDKMKELFGKAPVPTTINISVPQQ